MADVLIRAEARQHFARIQKKASKLGLNNNDILRLELIKRHQKPVSLAKITFKTVFYLVLLLGLVAGLGYAGFRYGVIKGKSMALLWAKYVNPMDLDQEQCLFPANEIMLDVFRPPQDCSFCEGIAKEDRVANLTAEDFKQHHAYSGKITIITDAMKDWTAQNHFSLKFFKKVYGKDSPVLDSSSKDCQFFRYKSDFNSLREVFNMPKKMQKGKGKAWYVGW